MPTDTHVPVELMVFVSLIARTSTRSLGTISLMVGGTDLSSPVSDLVSLTVQALLMHWDISVFSFMHCAFVVF